MGWGRAVPPFGRDSAAALPNMAPTWHMHWTAGFGFCNMSLATGPPPVMCNVGRNRYHDISVTYKSGF